MQSFLYLGLHEHALWRYGWATSDENRLEAKSYARIMCV